MANFLTNIGEEFLVENNADGVTVTVGLYNQATDALGDGDDLAALTSKPSGSNYSEQSTTVSTKQISGNYGFDTDTLLSFDTSDSTQDVDHAYITVSFTSDSVAGDSADTQHIIGVGSLSQLRDLSQVDTVDIAAGDLDVTLD